MSERPPAPDLAPLEERIGYRFQKPERLIEALSHSSYVNERLDENLCDNERLEFLGDAVLNLVVGHLLMRRCAKLDEGALSRTRAKLVNETQLAAIARTIDIGAFLRLGKGEQQTRGRAKKSILADALEAVVAAVYLDGGFDAAVSTIEKFFVPLLEAKTAPRSVEDAKSRLQEWVQERQQDLPRYEVVEAFGPDHDKTFHVRLTVGGLQTEGFGKSKKAAEQAAAQKGLERLTTLISNTPDP